MADPDSQRPGNPGASADEYAGFFNLLGSTSTESYDSFRSSFTNLQAGAAVPGATMPLLPPTAAASSSAVPPSMQQLKGERFSSLLDPNAGEPGIQANGGEAALLAEWQAALREELAAQAAPSASGQGIEDEDGCEVTNCHFSF